MSSPSIPMASFRGDGASRGVGAGRSVVVPDPDDALEGDGAGAHSSAREVFEHARTELEQEAAAASGEIAEILRGQLAMLSDPAFLGEVEALVGTDATPVRELAAAIEAGAGVLRDRLAASSVTRIQERVSDVDDLATRLESRATGRRPGEVMPDGPGPFVLVADDLLPSQTARIDPERVVGIVLEGGGPTAHAAIIARALGIPLVTGVTDAREEVGRASEVLLDGDSGEIWIDPDHTTRDVVLARATADEEGPAGGVPVVELDGGEVGLAVNIGAVAEAARAVRGGARAVGLLRSELLAFAGARTREAVAEAVRAIGETIDGPVVFRLLDVGGDKPLDGVTAPGEPNPMLGARGVRLIDTARTEFVEQLVGLASAAEHVDVRISVPMVIDPAEVERVRALWSEVTDRPAPPIGIMVETPAAVLLIDELAAVSDFLSIGTNDLTQYLLAADRGNPAVAGLVDPAHPAVLRAVRAVVTAGDRAGIPVAVCGQMAADPRGQRLLVGLGVQELSVPPDALLETARALTGVAMSELRTEAEAASRWPGSSSQDRVARAAESAAVTETGAPDDAAPSGPRFVVTNPEGLHVRPASQLAEIASRLGVSIAVRTEGGEANADSVFSLLALGIDTGTEVEVDVTGDGAEAAWPAILDVLHGRASDHPDPSSPEA